ncbi:nicotinate-nucleotide adenylyltransferase [Nevskia sp.]|uniref:nicotinate-nucleotide adenylyltransferase n=1 Tax=Nevskia sp. TaxID=1929292 RepID=UPI0025CF94D4|nr:nicotinate-nucleotide adenylyltransferase [Nevskia sp.]
MSATGVFGGTFAPIHNGHLRLAIELREKLGLSEVLVIPSARPPHRAAPGVSAERRLEWVRLGVGDEPGLTVDAREVRRLAASGVPSYTYDTLAELKAEHPDTPLMLLLGDDAANQLHTWHRWRELFELANLVFVERPYEPPAPSAELAAFLRGRKAPSIDALHQRAAGWWLPVSVPPLAISSTRVRQLLQAGRSVRGLVPDAVIRSLTPEDVRLLTLDEDPAHD